jgi:hypothetical protein
MGDSIIPDLVKAFRQNRDQKTPEKFNAGNRFGWHGVGFAVFVEFRVQSAKSVFSVFPRLPR